MSGTRCVAAVAEQLDGDGSLKCVQQLVGVGVHLPWTGTCASRSEDSKVTVVERHELMECELGVGLGDVDRAMGIHDCIIVRGATPPTSSKRDCRRSRTGCRVVSDSRYSDSSIASDTLCEVNQARRVVASIAVGLVLAVERGIDPATYLDAYRVAAAAGFRLTAHQGENPTS